MLRGLFKHTDYTLKVQPGLGIWGGGVRIRHRETFILFALHISCFCPALAQKLSLFFLSSFKVWIIWYAEFFFFFLWEAGVVIDKE